MVSLHSLLSNGWVETKEGAKTRKRSGTLAANTINKPTLQINKCELPIDKCELPINKRELPINKHKLSINKRKLPGKEGLYSI